MVGQGKAIQVHKLVVEEVVEEVQRVEMGHKCNVLFIYLHDVIIHGQVVECNKLVNELEQVEEDLRQWCKEYQLRLGDQNTKFFANMAWEREIQLKLHTHGRGWEGNDHMTRYRTKMHTTLQ